MSWSFYERKSQGTSRHRNTARAIKSNDHAYPTAGDQRWTRDRREGAVFVPLNDLLHPAGFETRSD